MTTRLRLYLVAGISVLIALVILSDTLFIVTENEQAIVLQFGAVQRIERTAGLKVKIPLLQDVVFYEKRLSDIEWPARDIGSSPPEVTLADQRRLVVDAYGVFRIDDPLKFYQAVRTDEGARQRLNSSMGAALRDVLGDATVATMLSKDREGVMQAIRDKVNAAAAPLGMSVVDVRISRANFPSSISDSIFGQMRSERQREASQYRAEGSEQSQEIRAKADRDVTVLLADARRQADILHGEGDAEATRIYADAFGRDPEFYGYYRTLDAYKRSLGGEDTQFVLSPSSDFLRYLSHPDAPKVPTAK